MTNTDIEEKEMFCPLCGENNIHIEAVNTVVSEVGRNELDVIFSVRCEHCDIENIFYNHHEGTTRITYK